MTVKSKGDGPCFTKTTKTGKKYTTCVGEQKRNVKLQREISGLHGRKKKKVTKAEFTDARAGLVSAMTQSPFKLEGIQVSPLYRDLSIATMRSQSQNDAASLKIADQLRQIESL
tara:strand:+ start:1277 stop:1618 length:342 start_codon:yes stop_codon:yes gene_type:complete